MANTQIRREQYQVSSFPVGGRLTLTTGVPVDTADVLAATKVYYTPYINDIAHLYADGAWRPYAFTQPELSLSGYTAGYNFDIFGYANAGTLALESLVWASDTARATALARTNGVLTKSGDATRRYLGTIRTTGVTGQTERSMAKQFVWNYYNRVYTLLYKGDTTLHTYTGGAWRVWNNNANLIIRILSGFAEDSIFLNLYHTSTNAASGRMFVGVGSDSTTAPLFSADVYSGNSYVNGASSYHYAPLLGLHYFSIIEFGVTDVSFSDAILQVGVFN